MDSKLELQSIARVLSAEDGEHTHDGLEGAICTPQTCLHGYASCSGSLKRLSMRRHWSELKVIAIGEGV